LDRETYTKMETPAPAPVQVAQAEPTPAPAAEPAPVPQPSPMPEELPKTASELPLLGLIGALSLAAYFAMGRSQRVR
jgi:hypothetical protein